MNSMKRQKDITLKDELPKYSIGVHMLLEKSGENDSRKNEERSQSKNNAHLWI